ncbi:MAG: PAS domain S-box protein [Thermodesulfobacteriota bacterium]
MYVKALIVDDETGARETLSDIFSEKGYSVTTVGTAAEALEEAGKAAFTLAIIDIKLPDMDGLKLLKELKRLKPDMLCVIVTAHASRENAISALRSGADDFFLKPLHLDVFLRRTEQALEKVCLTKKLGESEEKFRSIFESSSDAIMLIGKEGFIDCNEATLQVFGLKDKGDFRGRDFGDFSPAVQADGRDSILAADEKMALARRDGRNSFQWTYRRPGDRLFPAEVTLTTMRLEGRAVMLATVRDITEKKRATDDLERLFNLSGSMACIIDFNGRFKRVSPAFSETLGYTSAELLSRPVLDFIHPDDRKKTLENREMRLKKGLELLDFENRYVCRDGSLRWLSWTSRPVPADGITLAIAYDITRRKEDEKAFETLVSATAKSTGQEFFDGLVGELSRWLGVDCCLVSELVDGRARCISMILDNSYVKGFEYELLGSPCEKVSEGCYCVFVEGVRDLFPEDRDLQDMNAQGYVGASLMGRDGKAIGVLAAISRRPLNTQPRMKEVFSIMAARASVELERIKAVEALKESEEMMRAISETAQDAIIIVDDCGRVIYWNPAAVGIFGYAEEEAIGTPFTDLIVEDRARADHVMRLARFRDSGQCELLGRTVEMKARKKDGSLFPIDHAVSAVTLRGKSYAIGIIKDISRRKEAEEMLNKEIEITRNLLNITEATAQTENLDELLERIVSGVGSIVGSEISMIYLVDQGSGLIEPASASGLGKHLVPLFRTNSLGPDMSIIQEAFNSGPLLISDLSRGFFRWLEGMDSLAIIPLKGKKADFGVLIQAFREKKAHGRAGSTGFTEREKKLFNGIGHHVSLAIEKATHAKEALDRAMELSHKIETIEVMHEIDKTILSSLNPEEIRLTVVNMIARLVPCQRSTVRLVDRERGGFVFAAGFGGDSAVDAEFVPFNETSAFEVVESLRPQYIYDLSKVEKPLTFEMRLLKAGLLSHIRVPLIVKSEITGVLHLASRRPAAFVPEDLAVLNKLSTQIVMALENSRLVTDLEKLLISTIKTLSETIDAKSPWTRGHSERVTDIALRIGEKMGLGDEELRRFEICGLLHDIGKIGTYEGILNKPGKLGAKEISELRKHSIKGAEILSHISQLEDIIPVVRHHHEFYDGTGYPDGLKGKDIPLEARILTVADTVDAMDSDRPYRKGQPRQSIFDELKKCSGQQFDPEVVRVYLDMSERSA